MIKLIGILIILIGFILKLDTIAVVIFAGIVTGLVSGLDFVELLTVLGEAFFNTRYMSIFLITLPVLGVLEKSGLKNTATRWITKIKNATVDNILNLYTFARITMTVFGIRLGGHVQFVRPVLYPMVESVANKDGKLSQDKEDTLKSMACAVDNYANFYGQNVFLANAGVLLIVGTLQELGFPVLNTDVAKASIPVALLVLLLTPIQTMMIKKSLQRKD